MKILKEIIPYAIIIVLVIVLRIFIITPVRVDGDSMYPTLKNGEILLLEKYNKNYQRNDIVVVKYQDEKIIKRIIGLPGDTIEYRDNVLYINEKPVNDIIPNITVDFSKVTLGIDEYFVMGDNRNNSLDSRFIGPINKKDIQGTTNIRIIPLNKIGKIKVEN